MAIGIHKGITKGVHKGITVGVTTDPYANGTKVLLSLVISPANGVQSQR